MSTRKNATVLSVQDVSFRRGKTILHDVTWEVRAAQHWCILGPNGCGKTTLINVITGYDSPTTGIISVGGAVFGQTDWREVRKRVGLVSSVLGTLLEHGEPVIDVVASGRDAKLNLIERPTRQVTAAARALLHDIGCGHIARSRWGVLSQGEKQKVLICRALMARYRVLILDEPCAGLDPVAREHFLAWMEKLGSRADAPSLVMVTHHVEEILPCISHVLLLKDGAIFAQGPKRDVLSGKNLGAIYGASVKLERRGGRYALRLK
jgi:iron complex transport system ATP-binding protein